MARSIVSRPPPVRSALRSSRPALPARARIAPPERRSPARAIRPVRAAVRPPGRPLTKAKPWPGRPGRWRRRGRSGWWPVPRWIVWPDLPGDAAAGDTPSWLASPDLQRYDRPALAALWRRDMLSGVWVQRLRRADSSLVEFVNNFYAVPGFHLVVRHFFGGRYRRAVARLAMRVTSRLAERRPDFRSSAAFEQAVGYLSGGEPLLTLELVVRGKRYKFLPWARLHKRGLMRLLRRSAMLHSRPESVRWVFSGDASRRAGIIRSIRRMVARNHSRTTVGEGVRAWIDRLEQVVRVA